MSDLACVFTGGQEESRAAGNLSGLGTMIRVGSLARNRRLLAGTQAGLNERVQKRLQTTLYAREQGPQCFEAEILFQCESAETFVDQLRECRLTWYWQSVREEGQVVLPGLPVLPRYRPLTLLTDQNWHDLVLDTNEEVETYIGDDDPPPGEHRNLMLFGLGAELASPAEASLEEANRLFLQDLGPLEVLFHRVQDLPYEYLFFRHEISHEVHCLLDKWRLDPENVPKVKPYKKLRLSQAESFLPDMKPWFR